MRLLLDQDVYAITRRFLRDLGHDVITAADIERSRVTDEELLAIAQEQARLFVTRDRDFGGLVFVRAFFFRKLLARRFRRGFSANSRLFWRV